MGAGTNTGGISKEDLEAHADSRASVCVRYGHEAVARDAGAARRLVDEAAESLGLEGTPRPERELERDAGTVEAARAVSRAMTLAGMLHERIALEVGLHEIGRQAGGEGEV